MDSFSAFAMSQSARATGQKPRVFDWDKAAKILRDREVQDAKAGLQRDMGWTGGTILKDGNPMSDDYTYLKSSWATPILVVDGEEIECWKYVDETEWNEGTKWPESSLKIFGGK